MADEMTPEDVRILKEEARKRDFNSSLTPQQLQERNSIVPKNARLRMISPFIWDEKFMKRFSKKKKA